jgi:hypothetical protein
MPALPTAKLAEPEGVFCSQDESRPLHQVRKTGQWRALDMQEVPLEGTLAGYTPAQATESLLNMRPDPG